MPNVSLFEQFCKDQNADYVISLLHTDVRWLSKGSWLKIFIKLFDILSEFLDDKPYMTVTDNWW